MTLRALTCAALLYILLGCVVDGRELSVTDTLGAAGEVVAADVTLADGSGVASAHVTINYDPQLLQIVSVTNRPGTLGESFYLSWSDNRGVLDLWLCRDEALTGGTGALTHVEFRVNAGAQIGMHSALTVASRGLGGAWGGDMEWSAYLDHHDGQLWVASADGVDTDGDGLTDREEQLLNGSVDYQPGAGDTDINNPDTDGDGMPDGWEIRNGLGATNAEGEDGASGDGDGDGMSNYGEYQSDTDPGDPDSVLCITAISSTSEGQQMHWQGGTAAWQLIDFAANLSRTGQSWVVVRTNTPPTVVSDFMTHSSTNRTGFYRIRAWRP